MKNNVFVFDSNSLISALLIPSSTSWKALKKANDDGILLFSDETLKELEEVLLRPKFKKYISYDDVLEYIERLRSRSKILKTTSVFTDCRDAKDNKFLNLAFDGGALCIVTGDADLLALNPFHEIAIINASAFLLYIIIA